MVEITTLNCAVCGSSYTYDDGASPQWASVFCGTPCRDAGNKIDSDGEDDFEDFEPDEDVED